MVKRQAIFYAVLPLPVILVGSSRNNFLIASGGVLDEQPDLPVTDDACDSEQSVAVAQRPVSGGFTFVAGKALRVAPRRAGARRL